MLHIIQNDPEVPPGNIIDYIPVPYIIDHPYRGEPLPELREVTALIVLGGAMGANDDHTYPFLADLKSLIRQAVEREIPYLGICLGGQLLAAALGSRVAANRWEELGVMTVALTHEGTADPLFQGISGEVSTFQWHHDSFDLPEGGILLASSPACKHQAFRIGTCAWGLQFHPEVTEAIIRGWCAWDSSTQKMAEELVAAFTAIQADYRAMSRLLLENFLTSAGR